MEQKVSKLNKSRSSKLKKVLLLPLTMLLTISCNQKTKEQIGTQETKPQLTVAEIRNREI